MAFMIFQTYHSSVMPYKTANVIAGSLMARNKATDPGRLMIAILYEGTGLRKRQWGGRGVSIRWCRKGLAKLLIHSHQSTPMIHRAEVSDPNGTAFLDRGCR